MNNKSLARIKVSDDSLYVKFENVGNRTKFSQFVNRWREQFPQSEWDENLKVWILPTSNLSDVKTFCDKMFWRVNVQTIPSVRYMPQLNLGI